MIQFHDAGYMHNSRLYGKRLYTGSSAPNSTLFSSGTIRAYSFVPATDDSIELVRFQQGAGGTAGASMVVELWSSRANGEPLAAIPGASVTISSVGTSLLHRTFTFPAPIPVSGGIPYHAVVYQPLAAQSFYAYLNLSQYISIANQFSSTNGGLTWTKTANSALLGALVYSSDRVQTLASIMTVGAVYAPLYGERVCGIRSKIRGEAELVYRVFINGASTTGSPGDGQALIYVNGEKRGESTIPSGLLYTSTGRSFAIAPPVIVYAGDTVDAVVKVSGNASNYILMGKYGIMPQEHLGFVGVYGADYASLQESTGTTGGIPYNVSFMTQPLTGVRGPGWTEMDATVRTGTSGASLKVVASGYFPVSYTRAIPSQQGDWNYSVKMRVASAQSPASGYPRVLMSGSAVGANPVIIPADTSLSSDQFYQYNAPLSLGEGILLTSYQNRSTGGSGAVLAWFDDEAWSQ